MTSRVTCCCATEVSLDDRQAVLEGSPRQVVVDMLEENRRVATWIEEVNEIVRVAQTLEDTELHQVVLAANVLHAGPWVPFEFRKGETRDGLDVGGAIRVLRRRKAAANPLGCHDGRAAQRQGHLGSERRLSTARQGDLVGFHVYAGTW